MRLARGALVATLLAAPALAYAIVLEASLSLEVAQ